MRHPRQQLWRTLPFLLLVGALALTLSWLNGRSIATPAAASDTARLQLAHVAPFGGLGHVTQVEVTLDGNSLEVFEYEDVAPYQEIPSGTSSLAISGTVPFGASPISTAFNFEAGKEYTALYVGDFFNQPLDVIILEDDNTAPPAGQAKLRIGHVAPFASNLANTTVDVRLQDGTVLLNDVQFGEIDTTYSIVVDAGVVDVKITDPSGTTIAFDPPALTVEAGEIATVLAIGNASQQPLELLAIINTPPPSARLYVGHLASFADTLEGTAVDVKLNGVTQLSNIRYGDSTGYLDLAPGDYSVEIFPVGSSSAAISGDVTLETGKDYTALAIGDGTNQDLALLPLLDDNSAPPNGKAKIRLGHLAPFADTLAGTTADVRLQDGTVLLNDVTFGTVDTSYSVVVDAGMVDVKITTPDGNTTLIDPMPFKAQAGDIISAFAVGDGSNQDLGVFAIINGNKGVFLPLMSSARLYVGHLAPFADTLEGTAVDIKLNGVTQLTNIRYGDSTGYLTLPPDDYAIEILPAGTTSVAISGNVTLEGGKDYTALAIGDGSNQELALLPLLDDNSTPPNGKAKIRLGHLAPFADTLAGTTADVRLQDGTVLLNNVRFGDVDTSYTVVVDAGMVDVKITSANGATTLIDPLPFMAESGAIISAFATGDGVNQPLGVFASLNNGIGSFLPLAEKAGLYVGHLAPFADTLAGTAVDIKIDGQTRLHNVQYGDTAGYIELDPDTYLVEVVPVGTSSPAISAEVTLASGEDYTALAIGDGSNQTLALLPLLDDNTPPPAGKAKIRLGHLAPFADTLAGTTADVRLQDGTVLLDDVTFGAVDSAYSVVVNAGMVDVKITTPDGGTTLINPQPFMANAGDIISAFAVGNGTKQDLGVFAIVNSGAGSFLPLAAELKVYHLAPFADTLPGTAVTVTLNGAPVLTNFDYGDSTPYLPVEPGDYLVEVFAGSSSTAAISANVTLEHAQEYTAIAAGDGLNQPLQLIPLVDDNTPPPPGKAKLRIGHLAPFADTLAGTAADIRLQDGTILPGFDDVEFGTIDTSYSVLVDAGNLDIQITSADGSVVLFDPVPVRVNDGDILSIFAAGNVVNQPVGIFMDTAAMRVFMPDTWLTYMPLMMHSN